MRSLLRRRPSPAIVISSLALFMSLGGVGYAAVALPHNSVGSYQLRNNAVTYTKIVPNAVGTVRANTNQLQERVWKKCAADTAMTGAERNGNPDCANVLPSETGTPSKTVTVPTTTSPTTHPAAPTSIDSLNLVAGASYLALANPTVYVQPGKGATGPETAVVACTLTVGAGAAGPNAQTRTITVTTPNGTAGAAAALPLQLAGPGGDTTVGCTATSSDTPAPTVSVDSALNALQIR